MVWVLLAMAAAFIFAVVDVQDKFIIGKELKDPVLAPAVTGIYTFLLLGIISVILGGIFLPLVVIGTAVLAGIIYRLAILIYFFAIKRGEVSRVIPVLATESLFVLLFALLFLGESYTTAIYVGIVLIAMSAFLISMEKASFKVHFNTAFYFALFTAILFALRTVIIKFVTFQGNIWSIIFWISVGQGIVGVVLFAFHHPHLLQKAKRGVKHLLLGTTLNVVGFVFFTFALTAGPAALVAAIGRLDLLFVFLITLLLSLFFPKIIKEKFSKPVLIQKFIAVSMLVIGVILII
ncbi:EamA family transporter [Candidatus Woesearchaeota archaeon]|nr:EamA family transporter [Candidatus Woesearchaeota archaeon]